MLKTCLSRNELRFNNLFYIFILIKMSFVYEKKNIRLFNIDTNCEKIYM